MDNRIEYRQMCQKLTETLMKDEMTAIMVQLKIDRATRSKVTDGRTFIDILEMRELIGVGNFHRLVPLLKDLELHHLATLLEKYMEDYKKATTSYGTGSIAPGKIVVETENTSKEHSIKTGKKEASSIKTSEICKDHRAPQEVICLACYTKLCYACAYMHHHDHEVVSMDDLSAKVQDEAKSVRSVFQTLEEDKKVLEDGIEALENKIEFPVEYRLQQFLENSLETMKSVHERCTDSVTDVAQSGNSYLTHITMVLSEVENDIFLTEEEIGAKLYTDHFSQLNELNKRERKMKDNESSIDSISQQLKDGSMEVSIRPTSISANLARVTHGCILGAVMANVEQMVIIRSQGNPSKSLEVTCTSCFDPAILYWGYTIAIEQGPFSYVVGTTLHVAPRKMEIILGCGSKLIDIEVDETRDILYFVKTTTTCLDLPKGSYITGLSPISGKMQDKGVIVSDKSSGKILILDNNFKLIKKIKYSGEFQMITCVFTDDVYKCAVATFNSRSVELLKANPDEEVPREFGKLRVQNTNMRPQSLLFDGTFFTVLWVSGEESCSQGQRWKVVAYKDDGEECNVCKEGSCDPSVKAVSISHVKNDTLLCFSNGTFDSFKTYKL